MADEALCFFTLQQLGEAIRTREVSPVEVAHAHLARCERLNPALNAFVTLTPDVALQAAQEAEREIHAGNYRGPLHGIPVGLKDIFDTAGIRTTHGSSFYHDNVPEEDAATVTLLKRAGAVILGKCNTHEFASGSTTNNPWYGASHNPWDLERSPGGSSGGSGAAVAAFLCPGATGTDTGGSIRNPAACNGIVGLKPTYGRVSLQGIYPNALSLDHPGPLTRTVYDAGLLLHGMAGYVPEDPTSANVPVPDFTAVIHSGVQGMRLAFCPDLHFCELDDAVANALEEAGRVLQELGASLETVTFALKDIVEETRQALHWAEFAALHRDRFHQHPEGYGEDVRERLRRCSNVTADDYVRACQHRLVLRRAFDELLQEVDALLLPSAPCVAPLIEDGTSTVNGIPVNFGEAGVPLRQPINVVGLPALAVPMGFSEGLPLSMQIIGPAWGEARILRIGQAYEDATPELRRQRPPHG
jgi:aspartyl-tRNA(Asn)/glutamyl-tRNA(Gln) amidotransferase subunit A